MTTIAPPTLRWYQEKAIDAFFDHVATASGDGLIVLPTGAGKSLTMAALIDRARSNYAPLRVAIIATQQELVQQNAKAARLLAHPRDVGIYSAGLGQKDATRPITVANIQSLAKFAYAFDPFDLALIDEAHTIADGESGLYRTFIAAQRKQNPALVICGLTATPYKLSSGSLVGQPSSLFAKIVYSADIVRLIEEGYLARPRTPKADYTISTAGVAMRGGEFMPKALADAVDVDSVTAAAVDEVLRKAEGRQHVLIFAVSVDHARHIGEVLHTRGQSCVVVHGELPRDERAYRLEQFTSGAVRFAIGVQILTTGFDFPAVDCVVLMRPTKSAGLYSQMVGRGLRTHPSKTDCLVIDLVGAIAEFGPIDAIHVREKNASKSTGEGDAPAKLCPVCEHYQAAGVRVCVNCCYEFPPPAVVISATASTAPILSSDTEPTWYDVTSVQYVRNEPKPPKTIPTLRVEYYAGYKRIASEWVCIEHEGYARTKAEQWWAQRAPERCPGSVDAAVLEADDLRTPTKIAIAPDPTNPKYDRITGYQWPSAGGGSGLPVACWSCGHWSETCTKWGATPPEDVQAVGCEDYTDEEPLPF